MKKIVGLFFAILLSSVAIAQEQQKRQEIMSEKDSLLFQYLDVYIEQLREPCFKLYPTDNMWTFLKLNTATGQIWQVQYSTKGSEYRFETELSTIQRVFGDASICGRFELYKTQNMYNFILLDTYKGWTYQVQWSTKPENRIRFEIY